MKTKAKQWQGPKSRCTCGHSGDGPDSEHRTTDPTHCVQFEGKGACTVAGCKCKQFTWISWLPEFERHLDRHK